MRKASKKVTSRIPHWLRISASFLPFPAMVLLAGGITLGPRIWPLIHDSYRECSLFVGRIPVAGMLLTLAAVVLSAGIAVGITVGVREILKLKALARSLQLAGCSRRSDTEGIPTFLVEDSQRFAFCHGILRPRIYFSVGLARILSPVELRAVLLHESMHARHGDPLRIFLGQVLAAAAFPLPLGRSILERYLSRLEVQADRGVVRAIGAAPLAGALAKLLDGMPVVVSSAASPGIHPTEARIRSLAHPESGDPLPLVPARALGRECRRGPGIGPARLGDNQPGRQAGGVGVPVPVPNLGMRKHA